MLPLATAPRASRRGAGPGTRSGRSAPANLLKHKDYIDTGNNFP
jgi:hypothetical protein